MKRIVVMMAFCAAIAACGSGDNKGTDDKKDNSATTPAATTNAADAENEKALEMIASLDCTTCHKISEKNIGPAYTEVAKKYETTAANIDSLAHKVIKGGQGVWGAIPMTPHPNVSLDSARQMVKYILSLKNQ